MECNFIKNPGKILLNKESWKNSEVFQDKKNCFGDYFTPFQEQAQSTWKP